MEDSTEKTFSLQEFQVGGVIIRAVEEVWALGMASGS